MNYPKNFSELFLANKLEQNLQKLKFFKLTPIQALVIPEIMQQRNVLAIAPTGSGKTLSFVIPLLQCMLTGKTQVSDGLQALVLTPTRELAMQIFTVLQRVGNDMHFTCSLVCGGHDVAKEAENLRSMNIIIATPGRFLQHLENQTSGFGDGIKFMIFDEVDQLLQMGFWDQVVRIADYFSYYRVDGRQNMSYAFFTATCGLDLEKSLLKFQSSITTVVAKQFTPKELEDYQNQSIRHKFIVHQEQLDRTLAVLPDVFAALLRIQLPQLLPRNLRTVISIVHECDKFDVFYSFIKSYQNTKIIAFLSTCRQVNFFYGALRDLHPGVLILKLSGRLKQKQREEIFFKFVKAKNALLLTTDIAARGLDCQVVDFVIQYDCFVDLQQFVHRAGRAARMHNNGVNVCFVSEQEREQLKLLQEAQVAFDIRNMKLQKAMSIRQAATMLLNKNPFVKTCAERAIAAYSKFIYVTKAFSFDKYDFPGIARSWGLGAYEMGQKEVQAATQHADESASESEEFTTLPPKTKLTSEEMAQVGMILDSAPVKHLMQFEAGKLEGDYSTQIAERGERLKSEITLVDQHDKQRYKESTRKPRPEESPVEEEFEVEEELEFQEEESAVVDAPDV